MSLGTRHTIARTTRISDTTAWLQYHGATWKPGDPATTHIVIQQPGQPDLAARIGDTLVWDGTSISVEPRERS